MADVKLDDVPPGEPISVSATLLMTYRRCPQQALGRVRGVYQPPSRASFKGLLAHRVFARHLTEGPIARDDLALVCRQETGSHLNLQLSDVGLRPSEFQKVVAEIGDLYDRFTEVDVVGFEQAEVPFEVETAGDVTLKGRIDALFRTDDGLRISDWKTGADLDDADAQLAFYAMAWERHSGSPPHIAEAVSLATGERRTVEPSPESVAVIEEEVAAMVAAIRAAASSGGDLERIAGPYCRWCPLLDDCEDGRSALELLD